MIKYIRGLNQGKFKTRISKQPISSTVDIAKVWEKLPSVRNNASVINFPSTVYFIKSDQGLYVGGVHNGGSDLHWIILPEYRKMGHLTKAMQEHILPHIFLEKEIQKITIDREQIGKANFRASENVALSLGFRKIDQWDEISVYELRSDNIPSL